MRAEPARIALLIKTVHQAIRSELDAALRLRGLTLPQVAVLVRLRHSPGASNADLARAAFVSPQSMAEVVQAMGDKGWITRSADPDNARVLRTTLTRSGSDMLRVGAAEIANVEGRLTGALKAGEEARLRDMLERCAAALGVITEADLKKSPRGPGHG
jgi:DNA-binding MarR family transcriptional regulator